MPYVAEPGSKNKLSKRKIAKYLKNQDFLKLYEHGERIASACGRKLDAETFNPVLVDFYRDIGFLPDAVVNYLLLLGWSLDGETEEFTRDEMIQAFSLDRVVKSPASFDPTKLSAFQQRHMDQLDIKKKVAMAVPYLQQAQLADSPPDCDMAPYLTAIIEASEQRMAIAGDILDYDNFFTADEALKYDEKAFHKRIVNNENALELLHKFSSVLQTVESFNAAGIETMMQQFVEDNEIGFGQIVHPVRLATTGQPAGFGLFQTIAILGKQRCLNRIRIAIAKADSS